MRKLFGTDRIRGVVGYGLKQKDIDAKAKKIDSKIKKKFGV